MAIRFSKKTLDFIQKASRQKKPEWLDKNRDEYLDVLVEPSRALMRDVSILLRNTHAKEVSRYRFPDRGIARIRRSATRAAAQGWYKDWIGIQAARDSGSLYEELPALYFHIAPGKENVFSAGGLYLPSSQQLRRIRNWVAQDARPLEQLLADSYFKKLYPDLGKERQVKTFPRGFPKDHPKIEWLKLTGFYVWRPIPNRQFFSPHFAETLAADWRQVLRLNAILDLWVSKEVESVRDARVPDPRVAERKATEWDW